MKRADTARTDRRLLLALAAITLLAFGLRWPAVHRLLPQVPEPDAFLVMHAQELTGDPALVRHQEFDERYPMLVTRILQALPHREARTALEAQGADPAVLEEDRLACAAAPYVRGRIVVLLISLLLVPMTWIVARRFVGGPAALIAAWLVATSLLHAMFSTQARPHGAHAALALTAVWGAMRLVESPGWARIAVGALLSSLAIACLQSGLFTLFPLAAAAFLSGGPLVLRAAKAVLVPVVAAAGAAWAYPVLPRIDDSGVHLGGAGGHHLLFSQFGFDGLAAAAEWFRGHDPFLFVTTMLGLVCAVPWLVRHARELVSGARPVLLVVLAYVVPYVALMCMNSVIFERFLLPLLPWCAILSAWAWAPFVLYGRGSRLPRALTVTVRVLASVALILPLVPIARFAWVSARPDTLEQATKWIRENVPAGDRILGSTYLSLPAMFDPEVLESLRGDGSAESNAWVSWQMAHPLPGKAGMKLMLLPTKLARHGTTDEQLEEWIERERPEWVVLETSRRMSFVAGVVQLRRWVEANGELVYESTGSAPGVMEMGVLDYQGVRDPAWRLFETRAFGVPVRIWRVRW